MSIFTKFWQQAKILLRSQQFSRKYQIKLGEVLKYRLPINSLQLERFFRTPMGEHILALMDELIQIENSRNGTVALRSALIELAGTDQGLSGSNFLRQLARKIQLKEERIFAAAHRVELLLEITEEMVGAIASLAEEQAARETPVNFSQLKDLRLPGQEYEVRKETIVLQDENRQGRQFRVILHQPFGSPLDSRPQRVVEVRDKPQKWRSPKTPVIVISHGLGSNPEEFEAYARHLASYGYLVAVPQHPGSDYKQIEDMLAGNSQEVFKSKEFIDRPLDVSYLLDELERRNGEEYGNKLDLNRVGVMGHSFGAYTALALAGGGIDFEKLETACAPVLDAPNISLLLQCRALRLPRLTYSLRDRRVKAVLSVDLVGSEVFSTEGLSHIEIPVFLVGGSEDKTAPAVLELMRVFPWLQGTESYLTLMEGKAHLGNFAPSNIGLKQMLDFNLGNKVERDLTPIYQYAYATSVAFFEVYLGGNEEYRAYLQSSYARYLSRDPFHFHAISSAAQLKEVICSVGIEGEKSLVGGSGSISGLCDGVE